MTTWHVSEGLAQRYATGALPEPDCWSVERHVEACETCAARVSGAVTGGAAGAVVAEVRQVVLGAVNQAPAAFEQRGPDQSPTIQAPAAIEQRGPGRRSPVAWPWVTGASLRGARIMAFIVAAAGAVGLAHGAHFTGALPLLLAVAPVVPVAGVAVSYGRHSDPLHELAASTPRGGLPLLLARTGAVLAVTCPVLAAAGLLLPTAMGPGPATWLLPGLALTLAALALGTFVGCHAAAGLVGGGWLLAVATPCLGGRTAGRGLTTRLAEQLALYFDGRAAQTSWAAALLLCAAVVAVRKNTYDRWETM
ncbi:zf-HC2 domain-containing protein [Streptomyces sp. BH105]|uniref:zf-HC2 domain-containing protein n=1 Tax=Streptomyces sp. BH105 TaxID=3410408 RepID=UPI003CF655FC